MADDVVLPGDGAVVATRDRDGREVQEVLVAPLAVPLGYAEADDLSTAIALPGVPSGAFTAYVTVEDGDIRWRPDGATTAPTADSGMLVPEGSSVELAVGPVVIGTVRLIAAAGTPRISVVYA